MSGPAFRRLAEDRRVEFQQFVDYAFDPEAGPRQYDDPGDTPERLGQQFGVVEDGELRSVCTHYDFTVSHRGEWVPLAALAGGTTPPEHRRRGYLGELLEGSLRRCRGEYPLAALWPFDYGCYERFGWAMASKYVEYTCPPSALSFGRDARGTLQRVAPDDWSRLRAVTESYGLEHDLVHRRDERWWRERIFGTGERTSRYVYALERDGRIRGYVAYAFDADGDGRQLVALYSAYTDREAFRGLLGLLSNHDSQVERIRLYRSVETELLDLVPDPEAIDCEVRPGTMVRVVDVVDALETVPYPDDAAGTLTISVADETAGWNDGSFELSVSDGRGTCRRVESADPDVRVDVGTLSQLVVGYHSVPEARRLADLWTDDDGAAARLAAWFPPRTVDPLDDF